MPASSPRRGSVTQASVGRSTALRMPGDAVPPRHRLHRAPDHRQKAEVVVGVEVVDRDSGVADARHLGVELPLDLGRDDPPLHPGGDEVLTARPEAAVRGQQRANAVGAPRPGRRRRAPGGRRRPGWAPRSTSPGRPGRSGALPSSEVLVTIPSRCARRIPREIAADMPKSSALTTSRISPALTIGASCPSRACART